MCGNSQNIKIKMNLKTFPELCMVKIKIAQSLQGLKTLCAVPECAKTFSELCVEINKWNSENEFKNVPRVMYGQNKTQIQGIIGIR